MEFLFLIVMSVVFPYSGSRGGFLHSTAALQPILWGLAAAGAATAIDKIGLKRNWNLPQARIVLFSGLFAISGAATALVFNMVVFGGDPIHPAWEESARYAENSAKMVGNQTDYSFPTVFINDPAGYALETNSSAVVIPNGDESTILKAAEHYQIDYLVLEKNHVSGLNELYKDPESNPNFLLLDKNDGALLFKLISPREDEH